MWRLITKLDDDFFMPLLFSCAGIVSVTVSGIPLILIKQPLFWKSAITDYIIYYEGDVGMYKICDVSFWTTVAAEPTTSSLCWFTQSFCFSSESRFKPASALGAVNHSTAECSTGKQGQQFVSFFAKESESSLESTWQSSRSAFKLMLTGLMFEF